jgi:hypothetical protein
MSLAEFVTLTARHILVNFCAVYRRLAHFQRWDRAPPALRRILET